MESSNYFGSSSHDNQNMYNYDVNRYYSGADTDVRHRLPLSVGISVGYSLNEKWSLTSGVNYTMLSSHFSATRGAFSESREQTLHTVGIPVNINFNVWRTGRLTLYLSAGGQIEKSVSGKLVYNNTRNGVPAMTKKRISDLVQLSVNGAAGVQFDFAKIAGLYAEPGITYYFDTCRTIETVYKANPLNFGLRVGLRFSL